MSQEILAGVVVALWVVVIVQGGLLLFLYRQFGLHFLSTAAGVSRDGLKVGKKVPDVELALLSGQRETLGRIRRGIQLILFVSPKCPVCEQLLPNLARAAESQSEVDLLIVSSGPSAAVHRLARQHGLSPPPAVADSGEALFRTFGVRVTPFFFLLSPDGLIRSKGLPNGIDQILGRLREAAEAEKAILDGPAPEAPKTTMVAGESVTLEPASSFARGSADHSRQYDFASPMARRGARANGPFV